MKLTRHTAIGPLTVTEIDGAITGIDFQSGYENKQTSELIEKTFAQLDDYFAGRLNEFNLPLAPDGTAFQLSVWNALRKIPYGETRTYKEIAEAIGNPKSVRAVGMANNRNPIVIIIPCHRVIGSNGKLVGYRGGLDVKEKLLELER